MSKSIKLKDENYIDSSSIMHNRRLLKEVLESKINKNVYATNNIDANDLDESGMYYLGTGCSNIPESAYMRLIVNGGKDSGDVLQIAVKMQDVPNIYIRTKTNNVWHSWIPVKNDNMLTASYSNSSIKNGAIYFKKIGNVVQFDATGDLLNLPIGVTKYISNISNSFIPMSGSFRCASYNNKGYIVLEISGNQVNLLNYDSAITSATNGGFMGTYFAE